MSILDKIKTGRAPRAQKVVIYAPEGFGKSTIAAQFPRPVFLDIEGSTSQMDVARLSRDDLPTISSVESVLAALIRERAAGTVVIDTVDWLESMVVEAMIAEANSDKIRGIEDLGYGKGYTIVREKVTLLLSRFDAVISAGINVVLLAHSKVVKFEPPDGAGPYDRYELKLSKQVAPLIKEWADMVLFGNFRTQVKERDKDDAGAQYKGVGGKDRVMYCVRTSAWDAKNRHELADTEKWGIEAIARGFANVGAPWETLRVPAPRSAPVAAPDPAPAPVKAPAPAKASVPAPAATPEPIAERELPRSADPIPGIEQDELPDAELATIVGPHEAAVNAFLRRQGHIKVDQSYRSTPAPIRVRIVKNPSGFLSMALAQGRAA